MSQIPQKTQRQSRWIILWYPEIVLETVPLPIAEVRAQLAPALQHARRLVLTAPTGSGKSTQIPQYLLDDGLLGKGQVVVLQPRRLPTRLLAGWVAGQRGTALGSEVGYQVRLQNKTSAATRIRYVTEGVLLRQFLTDPTLPGVQAIIFDEFHERHLYGDITLARALALQETERPDLLIIVMSATLDTGSLETYLAPCQVLASAGRTYPVTVEHISKPVGELPVWEVAAAELQRLTHTHRDGDALVFMPGSYEIQRTVQAVQATLGSGFVVLPLHGELSPQDQDAAVARYDRRKVVVATNVAETSLTIDGVRLVVDSGLARIPRYDPRRGINTLLIEPISRASAEQRAGRAGRTAPGHCLRLWTDREHRARRAQEQPEIKRLDLAEAALTLKAGGVDDLAGFRGLEAPDTAALARAEQLLEDLGATRDAMITQHGRRMLAFPLHPRYARMLLAAEQYGCVRQVALIAALTQGRELLVRNQGRRVAEQREDLFGGETQSDLFVLMRAWRFADQAGFHLGRCRRYGIHAQAARQVRPVFDQFLRIAARQQLDINEHPAEPDKILRCLLVGFSDHIAHRLDRGTRRCALVHGRRGVLARDSVVDSPLLVATEVTEIEGRSLNVILGNASAIEEQWLQELFPNEFHDEQVVQYDPARRRVTVVCQTRFRDLVLQERVDDDHVPADKAAALLASEVLAGRCALKHWDHAVEQWLTRVAQLAAWMPELGLPTINDDDRVGMLEQICLGAVSYKEIKDRPVAQTVRSWLSVEQQRWIDEFVPDRLRLPNGRRARILYTPGQSPTLTALIKDLYDLRESPRIASGRVPLAIEILAPNHRPVQRTDDLRSFWQDTYPRLKKELQRKYPKHEWR